MGTQIKKTESRHVEYKTGGGHYPVDILPSHIRKYGSAFLNSSGGVLCVGVTDEGMLHNLRINYSDLHMTSIINYHQFKVLFKLDQFLIQSVYMHFFQITLLDKL